MDWLSNGGHERKEIWHKASLQGEDDAQMSNTCIAQRKHAIPHSAIKTHHNIWHALEWRRLGHIVCFNDGTLWPARSFCFRPW